MIRRDENGDWKFTCSSCRYEEITMGINFKEARDSMYYGRGWRYMNEAGWKHFCPKCVLKWKESMESN